MMGKGRDNGKGNEWVMQEVMVVEEMMDNGTRWGNG